MQARTNIQSTLSILASILLAAAVFWPGSAWAQQQEDNNDGTKATSKSQHTPSTTFKNDNGEIILQTNADGGLVAPGDFSTGAIPTEGPGTRLMWYPEKAAFRAGKVNGSQWDASNVGVHSVALGNSAFADEPGAIAIGAGAVATGPDAVALGSDANASASRAFATGFNNDALAEAAVAMGDETDAIAKFAVTMGDNTTASGIAATAMGNDTDATSNFSTALGSGTTADGEAATAMGDGTEATARDATAMGDSTTASGPHATAMGSVTSAEGEDATAMGTATTASGFGATAMGFGSVASGQFAAAMGSNTTAATDWSLSIGECNSANGGNSGDGTLFVVGNGSGGILGCNSESDALVLTNGGDLTIAGTLTENSDRRLKTDLEPLSRGTLEKLTEIRPVRFRFKNEHTHPAGEQIGLIAQDVKKEFPSLVSKDADGYLSLAYPKLTAVLLKGLQEQQRRIDSLQNRVQQVETLRERVARLEAESNSGSVLAGVSGSGLLLGLLIGGLLGAGLIWRRRS